MKTHGFVEGFLLRGEQNAIETERLVALTGFRNARELQREIERERRNGALILSRSDGEGGYFLPSEGLAGQHEISRYVRTLRARALNTLRTLRAADAALADFEGQIMLEGLP